MALCSVTIAAVSGLSGRKMAAKYWSWAPAQLNGPRKVLPLLTFLAARRSTLSFGHVLDVGRGVRRPGALVAEASRPHGIRLHRLAVLRDHGFERNHVGIAELESLANRDVALRVLVSQLARRRDSAAGAAHVERRIDLVPQVLVIGVEAERKPELRGSAD